MKRVARKITPSAIAALFCLLSGCLLLTGGALPDPNTSVHDSPGGLEIGRWEGNVSVLAVQDGWALVRMSGWVPAGAVDCEGADGLRVQGSPGSGLWATGVRIREDFVGDAQVTGRLVNATGQDLDGLMVDIVLLDDDGLVLEVTYVYVDELPRGEFRAFSATSLVAAELVSGVEFQM